MSKIIKRLASEIEVNKLYENLVADMWNDTVNYSKSVFRQDFEKGYQKFREENMAYLKATYMSFIMVDEVPEVSLKVFTMTATSVDISDGRSILTFVARYVENNGELIRLDDGDNYFNCDAISNTKVGRPNRPSENSIIKSYEIKEYLNDGGKIDKACKKYKLAKSTYYRTAKWLSKNTVKTIFNT